MTEHDSRTRSVRRVIWREGTHGREAAGRGAEPLRNQSNLTEQTPGCGETSPGLTLVGPGEV